MVEAQGDGAAPQGRVILADDEHHVRAFLRAVLKGSGIVIVAEASNGAQAVALFRQHRPDLLVMDLNMPVLTGEEALKQILAEFPEARVVILTSMADRESVESCMELGAVNYLRKDCPPDEIRDVILAALRGDDPTQEPDEEAPA